MRPCTKPRKVAKTVLKLHKRITKMPHIVVTSPSFSRHPTLRQELLALFPQARFREEESVLTGQALLEHIADADALIVGLEKIDEALLAAKPGLRLIAKYGVGLDSIDQEACARHGVAIGWTGGINARSVSEIALGFMLGLTHNVFRNATLLRDGVWNKRGGILLSGKTVGIVGLGHIGRDLTRLLAPFGCRILGNDIEDRSDFCREWQVTPCDKETLYAEADIVTLHVPLTPLTHHLINAATLARLKPGAFLINTSRGSVVDQAALHAALAGGALAGAALDVYEKEPPDELEFLRQPGLVATPHIAGNANEVVLAMGRSAIAHLRSFFEKDGATFA